jgi:hypothetical protein
MELEVVPVKPERGRGLLLFPSKRSKTNKYDLYLTLNFSEQWEQLSGGRIKFGVKAGELRLKLENAKIPYESRTLNDPFEVSIDKERQKQEGHKTQRVAEGSWDGSKTGAKANFTTEQTEGSTDKFYLVVCQLETKGTPEEPAWNFRVETGEPVLRGSLIKTKLATIEVIAPEKPWYAEATFNISSRDVKITGGERAWLKDLIPEKREALDIALAKLLLKHKLKSPLSRVKLPYD